MGFNGPEPDVVKGCGRLFLTVVGSYWYRRGPWIWMSIGTSESASSSSSSEPPSAEGQIYMICTCNR